AASPASARPATRTVPTVSTARDAGSGGAWTSAEAERFSTPARMAGATPDSPRGEAPAGGKAESTVKGAAAAKNGGYFAGVPTVGTFFHYVRDPATDQLTGRFC